MKWPNFDTSEDVRAC